MATITAQTIAKAGLEPSYAAVNSADQVKQPTDQRLFVHVKNGGGGSINLTVPVQSANIETPEGGAVTLTDLVVAIGQNEERIVGPFPPAYVSATGFVELEYSGTTTVTAAAFTLPRIG